MDGKGLVKKLFFAPMKLPPWEDINARVDSLMKNYKARNIEGGVLREKKHLSASIYAIIDRIDNNEGEALIMTVEHTHFKYDFSRKEVDVVNETDIFGVNCAYLKRD